MEVLDIGLKIPAIFHPTIVMAMVFLMMKVFTSLREIEDVDIGLLRPATTPTTTTEFIILVKMMDIGIKIPVTLPLTIVEFINLVSNWHHGHTRAGVVDGIQDFIY